MEKLIVFIKNPGLGKVKTRLAKSVGDEQALSIYNRLIDITLRETDRLDCKKDIWFSDSDEVSNSVFVARKSYTQKVQKGDSLGERMLYAFQQSFQDNFEKVVIIGSDCPELRSFMLEKSFQLLDSFDLVIGPAQDEGYYLLGMNGFYPEMFSGINWSTSSVLRETIKRANDSDLLFTLLDELNDIDTIEDLNYYRAKGNIDL